MKIAITSQDRATVTGHAGRCERFWVYEVEGTEVRSRSLVEVPPAETFHASHHAVPAALTGLGAFITAGMGAGLAARFAAANVRAVITTETDPDRAVARFLAGTLDSVAPHAGHGCGHEPHPPRS